jgi:hypothetical protein
LTFDAKIAHDAPYTLQKIMKKTYFLGLIAFATMMTARADIIPTLFSTTPSGSNFTWDYTGIVTANQTVTTNDYFTIYDFGGYVAGSATAPVGWIVTVQLLGTTPSDVNPTDNPSLFNLTWKYVGTTPLVGQADLGGQFTADSIYKDPTKANFTAQATRSDGPQAGTKVDNIGMIDVPVPEMSALLPILSVCGAGLLSLVPSFLRRRQDS